MGKLVLERKIQETVVIGGHTVVTVEKVNGGRVSLSFDAPDYVGIFRGEVHARKKTESEVGDADSGRLGRSASQCGSAPCGKPAGCNANCIDDDGFGTLVGDSDLCDE